MPSINFSFSGWVRGAEITSATDPSTGDEVDVSSMSAKDLTKKLEAGELQISLGDFLYQSSRKTEVEMFDFDEED